MNYVITIARGFGSGGKYIGKELSKRLGIPCYDSKILKIASNASGINKNLFHQVDERLRKNKFIKKLTQASKRDYVVGPTERQFTSDDNLYHIQKEIIENLADTQSCIIIGKCANHILRERDNVVSVYIEAPRKDCVESIKNLLGVTDEEAHSMIQKTDKYRADYYEYYTRGENWTNPVLYDMTLNSARVGRDQCVDLIIDYLNIKFGMEK
ncbi:cytidylate kinase [Anaerostipes sp. 992a]|uniref:cytidylate kinase-like family protein n=1 Tax=Anaerostipes sp. 992a TaxID=1261637 RepID=UPI000950E380|nr:cytidylate kinase-like family protein [Anaerostipes sp. 992a]OLR58053.1 cytidylate kinase [Anaerostipes sp. 992a]